MQVLEASRVDESIGYSGLCLVDDDLNVIRIFNSGDKLKDIIDAEQYLEEGES